MLTLAVGLYTEDWAIFSAKFDKTDLNVFLFENRNLKSLHLVELSYFWHESPCKIDVFIFKFYIIRVLEPKLG